MIEEWDPCLEGVRHAHPIDLREDVSRKVGAQVKILQPGERIQPRAGPRVHRDDRLGGDRGLQEMPKSAGWKE